MIDKVLERMIIQYELYKKQVIIERTMKEGELEGLLKLIQTNKIKGKKLIKNLLEDVKQELNYIKAKEDLLNRMNKNLDETLKTLDFDMSPPKYPKDVQTRIDKGLCSLKRPGKGGFICNNTIIPDTKYCKEHLQQFDKITYLEKTMN